MDIIKALLVTVVGRLVADDIREVTPSFLERLMARALNKLPPERRERFAEEWNGNLSLIRGTFPKLWEAAQYIRAAKAIDSHDRKVRESIQRNTQMRKLISQFCEQFLEEIHTRPELSHLYNLADTELPKRLEEMGFRTPVLAAVMGFAVDWKETADNDERELRRQKMRGVAKIVLDRTHTKTLGRLQVGRTRFEAVRFMGKLIVNAYSEDKGTD